jgi:hypothetical protein
MQAIHFAQIAQSPSAARWPLLVLGLYSILFRRCVDPLDGTKEFIKRNGDFTVNIGLCVKGAPFAGVVYCPALDPPVIYKGVKNDGFPIKEECDAVGGAAGYDSFKTIQPKVRGGEGGA